MTPAKFAALVRLRTKSNATTLTDANLLLLMNAKKDEMSGEVASEVNEDLFVMRFTRNLVAGQRAYALPSEILTNLKFVEAILDGTNQVHLEEFDITAYKEPLNETNIRLHFADRKPSFDITAGGIVIYSGDAIVDVTDGLIAHATMYPKDISDLTSTTDMSVDPSTTEFGVPRPMHQPWLDAVVIEVKNSKDKPLPLTETEKNWLSRWEAAKRTMKGMNLDRVVKLSMPILTGQDF